MGDLREIATKAIKDYSLRQADAVIAAIEPELRTRHRAEFLQELIAVIRSEATPRRWWTDWNNSPNRRQRPMTDTTPFELRVGATVRITSGLGEGQEQIVQRLIDLPMGTGVEVVLNGDYLAVLNPAYLEVITPAAERTAPMPSDAELVDLYLNEYKRVVRDHGESLTAWVHPTASRAGIRAIRAAIAAAQPLTVPSDLELLQEIYTWLGKIDWGDWTDSDVKAEEFRRRISNAIAATGEGA